MGIQHISIAVADLEKSEKWYLQALKPIGCKVFMHLPHEGLGVGMSSDGGFNPDFWMVQAKHPNLVNPDATPNCVHIAFGAPTRRHVDEFYKAAIAAGGVCNGKPGIRPYMKTYYAAFVKDPDGNNIELFCIWPAFLSWILDRKMMFLSTIATAGVAGGLKFFGYY